MTASHSTRTNFTRHKASGQYVKKVNGKQYYLGKTLAEARTTWGRYEADFR